MGVKIMEEDKEEMDDLDEEEMLEDE